MDRQDVSAGLIAILASLSIIAVVLVPFWPITLALAPLPVYLIVKEKSPIASAAFFLVFSIVAWILLGVASLLPIFVVFVFGFIAGYLGAADRPGFRITVMALLVSIFFSAFGVTAYLLDRPGVTKMWADESAVIRERLVEQTKVADQASSALELEITRLMSVAPYLFFGIIALGSVWLAVLNYFFTGRLARARDYEWQALPRFSLWQIPWYLAYGFIIGLAGLLLNKFFGDYWLPAYAIGLNFILLFGVVYLVQGLAIVAFYIEKNKLSVPVGVLIMVVALLSQMFFQGLSWLGLFDTWFNFRRLASSG